MRQILSALILGAVCAVLAYPSPRDKHKPQARCQAYINDRWAAEQDAIHTSRQNYRRLATSDLATSMPYSQSVREFPILYWNYSRRRSRRCRRILARSEAPGSSRLTAKALKMEADSRNIDDAWFQVTVFQGFSISDSSAQLQMMSDRELRSHTGCTPVVAGTDGKTGTTVPTTTTVPCP